MTIVRTATVSAGRCCRPWKAPPTTPNGLVLLLARRNSGIAAGPRYWRSASPTLLHPSNTPSLYSGTHRNAPVLLLDPLPTALQLRNFSKKKGKKGKKAKTKDAEEPEVPSRGHVAEENAMDKEVRHYDEEDEEEDDDDNHNDGLPNVQVVKQRMNKVVVGLQKRLVAIRGSEPTPDMFDVVRVKGAYGTDEESDEGVPLSAVAQVVITSPTRATLTCFDPSLVPAVRKALQQSRLNLNPDNSDMDDEGVVVVPLPRVSAETRQALAKELNQMAETARRRIRHERRKAQDVVKLGKDGKLPSVSKDEAFQVGKQIDAATEQTISTLNDMMERKQQAIMAV